MKVVTFLWRDESYRWNDRFRYGPDHVNRLRNAVRRNLRMDHEFVCVTDDPTGIDPGIRIVPLWPEYRELGGCYVRLKLFSPEMAELIGPRFVSIDLDSVVVGDLTPLFSLPHDFVGLADPHPRTHYCGSMFMMDAGCRSQVWETFTPDRAKRAKAESGAIGTDQAWISHVLGPGEKTWSRYQGVWNFRLQVMPFGRLPGNARIVFFTGPVDPSQPQLQQNFPFIREHWR